MKKRKPIDPRAQIAIAIVAPLLVLAVGWKMVVSGQNSKAASVAAQVEAVDAQVEAANAAVRSAAKPEAIRTADIFRLAKAMPDTTDMPGIILQLNQVAGESGISFTSIRPQQPTAGSGYQVQKIDLTFAGNFYALSDFLYRLRALVGVRAGELNATGRLFTVDTLNFSEDKDGFPQILATLTLDAFVYGTGAAATPAAPTTPTDGSTTTTTTTETTTTTPTDGSTPPAGATAAAAQGIGS